MVGTYDLKEIQVGSHIMQRVSKKAGKNYKNEKGWFVESYRVRNCHGNNEPRFAKTSDQDKDCWKETWRAWYPSFPTTLCNLTMTLQPRSFTELGRKIQKKNEELKEYINYRRKKLREETNALFLNSPVSFFQVGDTISRNSRNIIDAFENRMKAVQLRDTIRYFQCAHEDVATIVGDKVPPSNQTRSNPIVSLAHPVDPKLHKTLNRSSHILNRLKDPRYLCWDLEDRLHKLSHPIYPDR